MKNGKAVKKLYNRLKRGSTKASWPEVDGLIPLLLFAILCENNSPGKAKTALNRLLGVVVDYNDLRVSTPDELARIMGDDMPDAFERAGTIITILNSLYEKENAVTMEGATSRSKRETRAYLDSLDGMSPYVAASVMVWGFGDNTVPVDDQILTILKREEVIGPEVDALTAELHLKRHIPASDATEFAVMLKKNATQRTTRPPRRAVKK